MPYRDQATYYRAALLLGLTSCETVVQWAEETVAREESVPHELLEVLLVAPGDLTALRFALQPLADENESPEVMQSVFRGVFDGLNSGKRTVKDSVTVLSQIRRNLAVSPAVLDQIETLEDEFMLADAGVTGDVAGVERRIREWLASVSTGGETPTRNGLTRL
jgi:hypothetical protein